MNAQVVYEFFEKREVDTEKYQKLFQQLLTLLFLGIFSQMLTAASGLPISDQLDFVFTVTKVLGGVICIVGFLVALYFHRGGRGDAFGTFMWFGGAGVFSYHIEFFAEKVGLTTGAIF